MRRVDSMIGRGFAPPSWRRRWTFATAVAGGLALAGCGSDPGGKGDYGQDFEKPAGVAAGKAGEAAEAVAPTTRRRQDIEESKKTPAPKGRGRSR
jgi:hypothetical protein